MCNKTGYQEFDHRDTLSERKKNIGNKHNRLKDPNWQTADQLAIFKHKELN